jgi:hypothetical protein
VIEMDYNFVDNLEALGRILYPWAILGATVFGIGFGLDRWTTRQARRERKRERTPRELDDERRELEEKERQRHWEQVLHEWDLGDKGHERLAEYQRLRKDEKQQPEWRDLYESERGGPEPDYWPQK